MRKGLLFSTTILTGLVLGFIGVELAGNILYLVSHHALFYTRTHEATLDTGGPIQIPEAVFHPYFAFINRPGRTGEGWGTNNNGFQFVDSLIGADPHCCDYPYPKRDDEVLVGIFGGSVADGFALVAQRLPTFVDLLSQIPQYRGKKIRILNFAMAGFRQPQQLMTLSYYLSLGQKFDLAIEIDGFNEVVTSFHNWESGVEPLFPADTLWGAWGRQLEQGRLPFEQDNAEQHLRAYHEIAAKEWADRQEACVIASCFVFDGAIAAYHRWQQRRAAAAVSPAEQRASLFPTATQSRFEPRFDIFDYIAARWADSSLAMARLLRGTDALYLHVLQPNQWYAPSGSYEPIDPDHIYKWVIDPVNRGYAALERRVPEIRMAGVDILDATMIFKGQPDRKVYIDDCCHYTDAGNEALFAAIVREVEKLVAASTQGSLEDSVR